MMNVKTFIDRPLLSIVISVIIVALGAIAMLTLPIEKYPDIAPPTINVWASYPGASAEAVQKSVVAPLEEAINGVDNMMYMTSSAGNGSASITIFFAQGTNADMAAVNVQNRVAQAQAQLPAEVLRSGVTTKKQQPGQLRTIGLESPGGSYDEAFLFASIREVVWSLVIAIVLVLLVVYLFLQDFRATLIPAVGIIVSLVGTFAFMSVAGFSINLLTLFALVLVIGTVVDNAIVVVEAVQARFDAGYRDPVKASKDATGGLTTALFTTTLIFMVIFIPVSFTGGTTGIFYKQFGLTMAVGISFISAVSLSAALCALILKPIDLDEKGLSARVRIAYNAAFRALLDRYTAVAMQFIRRRWMTVGSIVAAIVLMVVLMKVVPTGFLLLVTPALFVIFQTLQERFKPITFRPSDDPLIQREMEIIEEKRKLKE